MLSHSNQPCEANFASVMDFLPTGVVELQFLATEMTKPQALVPLEAAKEPKL
jgi:hypothetical protein